MFYPLVVRLLESRPEDNEALDQEFRREGHSLRSVMREIPPVLGGFY